MKKLAYSIALAALIVGCSQSAPKEEPKHVQDTSMQNEDINQKQEIPAVVEEAVKELPADMVLNDIVINEVNNRLEKIYFDFDKYDIRQDMLNNLSNDAEAIKVIQEKGIATVVVEGNCDEWGSEEYNQALGLKRAKAVKQGLEAQGVYGSRIILKTYGESNPVCTERTKECDAKNRRAEIKIQL